MGYSNKLKARWRTMIQRCTDIHSKAYKNYGGRGIKICERWLKFENFDEDLKNSFEQHLLKYGKNTWLERIDNNGNYELSNIKWATQLEQVNNRRNSVINGKACSFTLDNITIERINNYTKKFKLSSHSQAIRHLFSNLP